MCIRASGNTTLSNSSNELLNILKNISNPEKKYRTRFLISGDENLYTLQVEDIAYFYSENKITFAVTKEGKEHIIDLSLDKMCIRDSLSSAALPPAMQVEGVVAVRMCLIQVWRSPW